ETPAELLPEMTLPTPSPGVLVAPPTVLPLAPLWMTTPGPPLGMANASLFSRPILLPITRLLLVPVPVISSPAPALPETRFPNGEYVGPPIVLPEEPPSMTIPVALAMAEVPLAFVPTRLFSIRLLLAPEAPM